MHIAILTFDGFNEIDSLVALNILNRVRQPNWRASLCAPSARVTSMNGVVVAAQTDLSALGDADAVIVGSGVKTREHVGNEALMALLALDPARQLVAAQCSGALVLARLGLFAAMPACTDITTRPWLAAQGVKVLDQAFYAHGNVATAGGCLASPYLCAWIIARSAGIDAARAALAYVAPVGEQDDYVRRAFAAIGLQQTQREQPEQT